MEGGVMWVKEDVTSERMTFEQNLDWSEGARLMSGRVSVPGRKEYKCKDLEMGCYEHILRNSKELREAGGCLSEVEIDVRWDWRCSRAPDHGEEPGFHSECRGTLGRGAWQGTVHGVTKSQTWLSDLTIKRNTWSKRIVWPYLHFREIALATHMENELGGADREDGD